MRKITVIYDGSHYIYRWLKALFWAKKEFSKKGYDIELTSWLDYFPVQKELEKNITKRALKQKHDIVFLAFHHSTSFLCTCPINIRIDFIQKIKENCKKLVWLDTADSTGTCLFEVMPYVDIYMKKQVLKDIDRYKSPIWGGRTYCEYYHNKLNIEDQILEKKEYLPLDEIYKNKIKISWNVGLGDLFAKGIRLLLTPHQLVAPEFVDLNKPKVYDIHFRGSVGSPIVGYQRNKCKELVSNLKISHPDPLSKVPYIEYLQEAKKSKTILSPFGWGEICTRDFESLAYGATLLKPSMEHCITYPNVYLNGETYVPINWDFSNFNECIENINSNEYKLIAKNGQELYKYYRLSPLAKKEFAEHIIKSIE